MFYFGTNLIFGFHFTSYFILNYLQTLSKLSQPFIFVLKTKANGILQTPPPIITHDTHDTHNYGITQKRNSKEHSFYF